MSMCVECHYIKGKVPIANDFGSIKKHFTILNLAQGYHQMPVHLVLIEMTAFITPDGHYEYLVEPFKLTRSLVEFQSMVNKILET